MGLYAARDQREGSRRGVRCKRTAPLPAARSVEDDLIVPPEPLEQGAADLAVFVAGDLPEAALPVHGVQQALLPGVDGQVEIGVRVRAVDQ